MATTTRTPNPRAASPGTTRRPAPQRGTNPRTVPRPAAPPRRQAGPAPAARPAPRTATGTPRRAAPAGRPAPMPRMPFVFLVVGLLAGGLVCLLVLNTILASGAFQLTSLQQANSSLAQRDEMLQQQVAQDEAPGTLAGEARNLGMVPDTQPHFVNLKDGKIYGSSEPKEAGR
jgi:hypothetical protein